MGNANPSCVRVSQVVRRFYMTISAGYASSLRVQLHANADSPPAGKSTKMTRGAAGRPRRALTARPRLWQPRLPLLPHKAAAEAMAQPATTASSAVSRATGAATAPLLAAGRQPHHATPRSGSLSAAPRLRSRRHLAFAPSSRCVESVQTTWLRADERAGMQPQNKPPAQGAFVAQSRNCYRCGVAGHFAQACPQAARGPPR